MAESPIFSDPRSDTARLKSLLNEELANEVMARSARAAASMLAFEGEQDNNEVLKWLAEMRDRAKAVLLSRMSALREGDTLTFTHADFGLARLERRTRPLSGTAADSEYDLGRLTDFECMQVAKMVGDATNLALEKVETPDVRLITTKYVFRPK